MSKPFVHDAYLAELTSLRDQLKAGLSANAMEPEENPGPTTAERADKIKALKATNTIIREREATETAAAESALLKLYTEVWLPRAEEGGIGIKKSRGWRSPAPDDAKRQETGDDPRADRRVDYVGLAPRL